MREIWVKLIVFNFDVMTVIIALEPALLHHVHERRVLVFLYYWPWLQAVKPFCGEKTAQRQQLRCSKTVKSVHGEQRKLRQRCENDEKGELPAAGCMLN
jgi:hypothetical protein